MIRLFSNIRRQLFTEGKLSKYLVYGTGEIILVVIGILIALQINNWNEERKSDAVRDHNYQQLLEDLKTDSIYVTQKIENFNANILLYRTYLETFKGDNLTMQDVMNNQNKLDFLTTTIRFQNNTIVSLENTGEIKLIPSQIRNKLTAFKRNQEYIMETNNQWNQNYFDRIENAGIYGSQPHFQDRIRNHPQLRDQLGIEQNLPKIIWSIEIAMLYKNLNERTKVSSLKELQKEIIEIMDLIKTELAR